MTVSKLAIVDAARGADAEMTNSLLEDWACGYGQ